MGRALETIQPRAVHPPRIVNIKPETISLPRSLCYPRHPTAQFHADVLVDGGPRRVDGGIEFKTSRIDLTQRRRIRGQVGSCTKIRASCADAVFCRKLAAQVLPKLQDSGSNPRSFTLIKTQAVKDLTNQRPWLQTKAHPFGKP